MTIAFPLDKEYVPLSGPAFEDETSDPTTVTADGVNRLVQSHSKQFWTMERTVSVQLTPQQITEQHRIRSALSTPKPTAAGAAAAAKL